MNWTTTSTVRVRYGETDQMGVVYHAHYLVWCDIGRTDFIRQYGTSYAQLEKEGLLLAVTEAQLRYVASAYYDDVVEVVTRLERAQSRLLTFTYDIHRVEPGPKTLLATVMTKLIALDRAANLRKLPQELLDKFKHVQATP